MELYKEIFMRVIEKEEINVVFPNLSHSISELAEMECCKALEKIKTIINDDSLSDEQCFRHIEKIICLLENIGIDTGNRHDFG